MKDSLIPLHEILGEIEFLNSLRDRMTFESFRSSSTDVRAASYSIIISEAVRRIPDEWLAEFSGNAVACHSRYRQQASSRVSAR
jgi:uncharacterized protein with HEPN domain